MTLIMYQSDFDKLQKQTRMILPVKASRSVRVDYNDKLQELNKQQKDLTNNLIAMYQEGATSKQILDYLSSATTESEKLFNDNSDWIATNFVESSEAANKKLLTNSLKRSFNVDYLGIVDSEQVANYLALAKFNNVKLIKSIPNQHWAKVTQAVSDNFSGTLSTNSLVDRLKEISNISTNKAILISRDQTSKLNGSLNSIRQQDIGINSYIWRTSKDSRVVGNPSGLYKKPTKAHGNHWKREGKIYYYERPPADGNPGEAIQCRCHAESRVVLDELNVKTV